MQDPLQLLPVEKWSELQRVFKSDWPRGMPAYYTLETQKRWLEQGFYYGFKVYCPYGDLWNGMVGINEKEGLYEIMILCPRDDTEKLGEALKRTKIINWNRTILVPFAPDHVVTCVNGVIGDFGVKITTTIPSLFHYLDKTKPKFDVSIPPAITFDYLKEDHIELINSKWPHRYPGSEWYFNQLIVSKNGYGLYQNDNLVAWIFINEMGALGHLFVLEDFRKKGFAELILKLLCNIMLEDGKDAFVFCVEGNKGACNLYKKLGFTLSQSVTWFFMNKTNNN
ncbi:uncharacterized protein LOC115447581 [Manduca sexta]|uniref:uncharacterized protein LOC115447581 n=1 Tax=Manduca sexta TaxID=7130 RepID=UPI0018903528|nr:uncharacterized protein LOC115447581 [Manduca sexta]XP_037295082.1 uncharacterized protein LOC115447581 [Manduca sexta]